VLTHCEQNGAKDAKAKKLLRQYNKKALLCTSRHEPEYLYDFFTGAKGQVDSIRGKQIAVVCSIGDPDNFLRMLEGLGAEIVLKFIFPDHHSFSVEDMQVIYKECTGAGVGSIITTAKDEPRLRLILEKPFSELKILILKIKIKLGANSAKFHGKVASSYE